MKFSQIRGYQSIKNNLIKSIKSNHVAHAMMFVSSEGGVGVKMALAFATFLNCENKQANDDSCGECPSCSKMEKLIHPDLSFFFPVSATKENPEPSSEKLIKSWREFLFEKPYGTWIDWGKHIGAENKQLFISKDESKRIISVSSLKSFEAEYKVLFIWLPEYFNPASANSLLKILEEPPEKTLFLLVTENISKILPTISSRMQIFRIPPYNFMELQELLINDEGIDSEKAESIAQIAQGNVNEALDLAKETEHTRHLVIREWLLDCYRNDSPSLINRADEFQKLGRESQKAFFRLTLSILREALAASSGEESVVHIPENQKDFIFKFSSNNGWEKIAAIVAEIDSAYYHLERNLYPKIVFLDTSLLISGIFRR